MNIFSLSFDDASPHPQCNPFKNGVIEYCEEIIKKYPNIKIDFFTSGAYARLGEEPYFLTQYPEWVEQANKLPPNNFRFNYHSYYHRRLSVKHGNSNNNEVEKTNDKETRAIISHMMEEFRVAGLKCEKVFRPPGWHVGLQAAKVLTEFGLAIAGNQKYFDILNGKVPGMKYLVNNWELREYCVVAGNVFAAGHTSNWCDNFLNKQTCGRIMRLLESREFEFKFLSEL